MQQGMIYHAITTPGRGVDIEQITFELDHDLDVERFSRAWSMVLDAHDVLRSSFRWMDVAEPVRVVERSAQLPITTHDWAESGPLEVSARIEGLIQTDRATDFDLSQPPLQRLHLARTGEMRWWGLWSFHHALLDGRSFPLVLRDVFAAYETGLAPSANNLFDDFAATLGDLDHSSALETWSERLADLEPAQPLRVHVDSAPTSEPWFGVASRTIPHAASNTVRNTAEQLDVSVNNVIQAAWAILLHRYRAGEHDGQNGAAADIVFGTTRACRHLTPTAGDAIGLLINTVPLRLRLDRSMTALDLVRAARDRQRELRAIEATPLHLIQKVAATSDVFDSLVVYDDASLNTRMERLGLGDDRRFAYEGQTNIPVTLVAYGDAEISLRLEYSTDRLSAAAAQRMIDQLVLIIESLADRPHSPISEIDYLPDTDCRLLATWNDTSIGDAGAATTLVDLFERQVDRSPDAIALRFGDDEVSYRAFNERANRLAHDLIAEGVGPNIAVGVLARRSIEMMVAIYGIMKAGGAYVPLDPDHPIDRLANMVTDAGLTLALTAGGTATMAIADGLAESGVTLRNVDAPHGAPRSDAQRSSNPRCQLDPSDAAYIIFTSGSTGRPKGVLNEHGAIVNRLVWMQRAFELDESDVVLQKTPFTFDVSVWELFWPLQVGAELVVAQPDAHKSTVALTSEIIRRGVTTLHFVPSMLVAFVDDPDIDRCTSIKRVICSGEALARDLQDRFHERMAASRRPVELHNLYGPTEAAVDVTWWACDPSSKLPIVPIGFPIDNTTIHVLDPHLEPVPPGAVGELFIGGIQVARGYVNRGDLTAERFIDDPHRSGERLYRTGDLGRHRRDGSLEYLGRTDHQVKIRGHRIELGEIETVLSSHQAIAHCVVIDREDRPGDRRLVAYVVPAHSFNSQSGPGQSLAPALEHDIRSHLAASLTDYMVPSNFVVLPALPLSTSGKVDRSELPAPTLGEVTEDTRPVDGSEQQIAVIWAELLEVDEASIGRSIPFFQAGGHSLLTIKLAARLSDEFGRSITVTDLLDNATVTSQATLISSPADSEKQAELRAVADRASQRRGSPRASARRRASTRPGTGRGGRKS